MQSHMDDYYKILGVSKTATAAEIKKAYRKLAQKHHPDLAEDKEKAKAEFQKLQQAYEVLKNPEKRELYDQLGPNFERMGGGAGGSPFHGPGGQATFDFRDLFGDQGGGPGGGGAAGFDFEDIMRQFTGGRRTRPKRGGPSASTDSRGHDVRASVTIPFSVAAVGGETSVSVPRGRSYQTIKVKIPAGIEDGKKIRLRGQGEGSPVGGPPGDLILSVLVSDHPHFRRQGKNLSLILPITIPEAIRGAKFDVPTPSGTVTVTIPPGTSSGKRLRLRGMGVQTPGDPGDLLLEVSIVLPPAFDNEAVPIADQLEQRWASHQPRQHLRW